MDDLDVFGVLVGAGLIMAGLFLAAVGILLA